VTGDRIQAFLVCFGKGMEKTAESFVSFLDKTLQEKSLKTLDTGYSLSGCSSEVVNRLDVFNAAFLFRGKIILSIGEEAALTIINVHHVRKLFQWHSLC